MDWRGRYMAALALLAVVVAVGIAAVTGAAPVPPIDKLGAFTPTKQPNVLPKSAGPAIVDAVYWPGTGPANAVLWLVFDKDVPNPGDFQSDDLVFYRSGTPDTLMSGLTFAYHQGNAEAATLGEYANVLAVTGFPASGFAALNPATDMVALRNPRRIPPSGSTEYKDATPIPVKTGPAITRVEVVAGGAAAGLSTNVGDMLRVYFTHMLTTGTVASGGDARGAFTFPELGTTGTAPTLTWAANDRYVDITFTDNMSQLKLRSGLTKVMLAANGVFSGIRSTAGGESTPVQPNMNPRWMFSDNLGPHLLRAGYSASLDRLTLVFDDDIQIGVLSPLDTGVFSIGGGITYGAISSDDGDNVLVLSGLSASPVDSTISIADPTKVLDYQDMQAEPGPTVTVAASPIIVLANFHDGGAPIGLDFVTLWFDVPLTAAPDSTKFASFGAGFDVSNQHVSWSPVSPNTVNIGNTNTPHWTWNQGVRVYLNGSALSTGDGVNASPSPSYAYVRDANGPAAENIFPDFAEVHEDTLFQHFHINNQEDRAYALLFTRRNLEIQNSYVQNNLISGRYTPIVLPNPGQPDPNLVAVFPAGPGDVDTQGDTLQIGDNMYLATITADAEGNVSGVTGLGFITVGLAAPRDFLANLDDDMIHIFGVDHPEGDPGVHYACGDSGSAPFNADSVRVYADAGRTTLLGSGPVDKTPGRDGSFGPIELDPSNTSYDLLYFVSVQVTGPVAVESADQTMILNDNLKPVLDAAFDPMNTEQIYSGGDTLRVMAQFSDPTAATALPSLANAGAINNLLYVQGDLSEYVTTAGGDAIDVTSLGANQVDDNHNWIDVAQDAAQAAFFTGNGVMDFPEPYVDENGNGTFDPGETFVDLDLPGYHAHLYDAGDQNLDANDPQEAGWYFFAYKLNDADLVADPQGLTNFAVLEDLPAVLNFEDNAVRSNADDNSVYGDGATFTAYMNAISGGNGADFVDPLDAVHCYSFSLDHQAMNDDMFMGTEDSQAPTVSEISFLERATDWTSGNSGNIIEAGDHVYTLAAGDVGSFFNLADSTLSDDDVVFVGLQIAADTNNLDDYQWLSLDPEGDANGDGMPGIAEYDDDNDGGIDTLDVQVAAAMDTTSRKADQVDNDGDAFFRIDPVNGAYAWFNIDESTTNGVDDDGDGVADNPEEVENYDYTLDDDEDGIMDGSAVRLTVAAGSVVSNPGYTVIYVKGFNDPDMIAEYDRTAGGSRPNNGKNPLDFGPLATNDGTPGKPDVFSMVTMGADTLATPAFALGGPNVISAVHQLGTDGLSPWVPVTNNQTAFAFDYLAQNGRNLNMKVLKSLYDLNDGDEYRLRAVAYDEAYQGNANWAVPLRFNIDSQGAVVSIPPPPFDDVVDTDPGTDGVQVCDVDASGNPKTYTLQADLVTGDVNDIASVEFQYWNGTAWASLGSDTSFPYTLAWTYPGAPIGNNPPARQDTVYFRTIATDKFGNIEPQALCDSLYVSPGVLDTTCYELEMILTDCTPPWSCLCQIGSDYNPMDGAFVPLESAVDLSACFSDGDGDSTTNDVARIVFQMRPVGATEWQNIPSLTGVPVDSTGDGIPDYLEDVTGIKHPIISTGPDTLVATVTWDTHDMAAGSYDLRAVAYDIEGNENSNMTCVATATLDDIGLRAYIQPCVDTATANLKDLFANVYIHDVAVKKVEFQYTSEIDGEGKPVDGATWVTIDTQGDVAGERKGDVVLRAGLAHVEDVYGSAHQSLADYRFYDVDGDGYNPVDPVYATTAGTFSGQTPVINTGITPASGATLTAFAADEYFADANGSGTELDLFDWIMKDNPLNGADTQTDLWHASWDISGLNGCYAIRAVATDQFGNVDNDVIEPRDGVPDSDTEIWTEECCVDSNVPVFCVTSWLSAGGVESDFGEAGDCPWVAPQDSLTLVATPQTGTESADVDSVRFYYWRNGVDAGWVWFATDIDGTDGWQGVFDYAELVLPTDTQTNFRAVAYDHNGNFDSNPDACKACLVLGENKGPETDIVYVVTAEGDTLDANTVLRGTLNPFCIEPTTLYMLVTAEDNQAIDHVEMWYRKSAGNSPSDTTEWAMVPGATDDSYPYEFTWDISSLSDGVYQFFPRAYDVNGNMTPTFGNPYWFSMNSLTAHIVDVTKNGASVSSLTPGEEVVLKAELDDLAADNTGVSVHFFYAERVEGEMLDVSSSYPYTATTELDIWAGGTTGMHGSETVWVNGVEATWYSQADFAALATKTKMDYTITGSNDLLFGAGMAADDTVTIDYNVTDCMQINLGDSVAPYSVAWDADGGGLVPMPTHAQTTHYDLMAGVYRTFDGYEPCGEDCFTDGFALPINDTAAPRFSVWGLDYRMPNAPGNPLCESVGGQDLMGPFGESKSKLSGIEHQFFVTPASAVDKAKTAVNGIFVPTDDGSDWDTVEMSIAGGAPVSFTKMTAEDDETITIPVTFYIQDLANVETDETVAGGGFHNHDGNDPNTQAVNPDSVENVTITMPGIEASNAAMYDDGTHGDAVAGDGVYTYLAVLPLGGTYGYSFSVDLIGDDQVTGIDDPRNASSEIYVPDMLWVYDTTADGNMAPADLFGVNQVREAVVTVTDTTGLSSDNLVSGGLGGGSLGQIWVTYDPTAPTISNLWLSSGDNAVAPESEVQVNVEIHDVLPATADIIKVDQVIVQVAVDDTHGRWRTILVDNKDSNWDDTFDTTDGGWGGTITLPQWMDPLYDGIDNNLDGVTDDDAEATYTYRVRVVAVDDCFNHGYCGEDMNAGCGDITVDSAVPQACLTEPADGSIVKIGDPVNLVATTSDTDVRYVEFQYWLNDGDGWQTIDKTPLNDDDDPWDSDGADGWTATWDTGFLAQYLSGDFYVKVRAVAVDMAGNDQSDDPELACDINLVMNDATGPISAITRFYADCFPTDPEFGGSFKKPFDPTLALSGEIGVFGRATGWNALDVATVTLQMSTDQTTWTTIGVQNEFFAAPAPLQAQWQIQWDTDQLTSGTYYLRAYATDADGNVQGDDDGNGTPDTLPVVTVVVDHIAPDFMLTMVGPESLDAADRGDQPMPDSPKVIRADLNDEETAICPENSRRITFLAADAQDENVEAIDSMSLEFLDDVSDPENPTWLSLAPYLGSFEYRDAVGDNQTPDGTWRLEVDSVDALMHAMGQAVGGGLKPLPSKVYRFRVRATDYACNTNEDNAGVWMMLDATDPIVLYIYAGDRQFEAGAGTEGNTVHVAGGDTVPLAAKINDGLWFTYPHGEWPTNHDIQDESSGIYAVQFSYIDGSGHQNVIGLGDYNEDTGLYELPWQTPANLPGSTDSLYTIVVVARDNAGNCDGWDAEDVVSVQDVTKPANTMMAAVLGDEDDCATYPRVPVIFGQQQNEGLGIDEAALARDKTGAKIVGTVARQVYLYASTPQGDASMAGGRVVFEGRWVNAAKPNAAGPWMLIGEGECVYRCPDQYEFLVKSAGVTGAATTLGPIWQVWWDTKAEAPDGSKLWYDPAGDGTEIQVRAYAVDAWGNAEENMDDAVYRLVVDNTAPKMTVKVDGHDTNTSVERNAENGALISAEVAGVPQVTPDFVDNDLVVSFFYKPAADLNEAGSWTMIPEASGIAPADDNPDHTRDYAFRWDVNGYRDADGKPLTPNQAYDVSVEAQDLVCNTTTVVQQAGLDKGKVAMTVTDTEAPVATIVRLDRDYSGAVCTEDDFQTVWNPEDVRINGVDAVWARILDGSTDTQDVKFYFRTAGSGQWKLADADIEMKNLDGVQTWVMTNWNTQLLGGINPAEGAQYELMAVGTDDAGNTASLTNPDTWGPLVTLIVDRVGPVFTGVSDLSRFR